MVIQKNTISDEKPVPRGVASTGVSAHAAWQYRKNYISDEKPFHHTWGCKIRSCCACVVTNIIIFYKCLYIFICLGLGDGWGMKPAIGRHDILKVS